jgi:hypothetical protein
MSAGRWCIPYKQEVSTSIDFFLRLHYFPSIKEYFALSKGNNTVPSVAVNEELGEGER